MVTTNTTVIFVCGEYACILNTIAQMDDDISKGKQKKEK